MIKRTGSARHYNSKIDYLDEMQVDPWIADSLHKVGFDNNYTIKSIVLNFYDGSTLTYERAEARSAEHECE